MAVLKRYTGDGWEEVAAVIPPGTVDLTNYESPYISLRAIDPDEDANYLNLDANHLDIRARCTNRDALVIRATAAGGAVNILAPGEDSDINIEASGDDGAIRLEAGGNGGLVDINAIGGGGAVGIQAQGEIELVAPEINIHAPPESGTVDITGYRILVNGDPLFDVPPPGSTSDIMVGSVVDNATNAIIYVIAQFDITDISGTFTLTFRGETTEPIDVTADGPTTAAALEALSTIGPGNIDVANNTLKTNGVVTIQFWGDLGNQAIALEDMSADFSGISGPAAPYTPTMELNRAGHADVYGPTWGSLFNYSHSQIGLHSTAANAAMQIGADGAGSSLSLFADGAVIVQASNGDCTVQSDKVEGQVTLRASAEGSGVFLYADSDTGVAHVIGGQIAQLGSNNVGGTTNVNGGTIDIGAAEANVTIHAEAADMAVNIAANATNGSVSLLAGGTGGHVDIGALDTVGIHGGAGAMFGAGSGNAIFADGVEDVMRIQAADTVAFVLGNAPVIPPSPTAADIAAILVAFGLATQGV